MSLEKESSQLPPKYGVKPAEEDFVPPDGGWGWIVSVATGMHLVCFLILNLFIFIINL